MFALPFIRRRAKGGAGSIPPGTYATLQDVSDAISQLIGGAPDVTLDTIAEIAARIIQDESSLAAVSAAIANKQDRNAKLTALSALALAADKLIYATGANTLAATDLTAFMRSVLAAQDAAGARAAIGAVGQQDFSTYKDTVTTAFANKQDKLIVGGLGAVLLAAEPAGNYNNYAQFALYRGGNWGRTYISPYGENLLSIGMAAGYMTFATNGNVPDVINTKPAGRQLLTIDLPGALTPGIYYLPAFYNGGGAVPDVDPIGVRAGTYGVSILGKDKPAIGSIFVTDANRYASELLTTAHSQAIMKSASAQETRGVSGQKASIVANTASNTPVPADTQTELLWPNAILSVEGFDRADIVVIGSRVTTAQATSMAGRCILSLVTSGPADFSVVLELRDATGVTVGNENGAPGQGTGGGWKTMFVPFRVNAPGHHSVVLPDVPLRAGGNFAQLRVRLYTPPGSATVNVSEYQMKIVQQA